MKAEKADQIIESGMLTFAELRRILENCRSDDLSSTCYFLSKSDVCEMILFAINGKRGVIKAGTTFAKFARWALVEFGTNG
jgi:hypothetical protein